MQYPASDKYMAKNAQYLVGFVCVPKSPINASLGVPSLVVSYLYTPLGLPTPDYKLTQRKRED
jgi:hypothetical protein